MLLKSWVLLKISRSGTVIFSSCASSAADILTSVVEMLRVSTETTLFGVSRFQRDGSVVDARWALGTVWPTHRWLED